MSLVDYASSSDEEEAQVEANDKHPLPQIPSASNPPNPIPISISIPKEKSVPKPQSEFKLPDASFLLNSPSIPFNETASRKRDSNDLSSSLPRNKLPRGKLNHSKIVPETAGGMLVPPQLKGRSNVVTEDISKLFVKRRADSQSRGSPNQS